MLVQRCYIGRLAGPKVHEILLTDVGVTVRILLWRWDNHWTAMMDYISTKVLILWLCSTVSGVWSQSFL